MIKQPEALRVILSQPRNWKVTALRASMDKLLYQMVYPYLSVYLTMLGASVVGLGLANGIGMGMSSLYGPVSASLMRREGTKRVYLGGIAIVALSYFLLGISWTGSLGVVGIIVWWFGTTETGLCCSVVCGSSLTNENRATAMGSCESVSLGIMSFIGPAAGAFIVGLLGGLKISALRPLFFMIFVGELGVFLFIKRYLGECGYIAAHHRKGSKVSAAAGTGTRKLSHSFSLLRRNKKLWRYVAVSCLTYLPTGMVLPFTQLFVKEAKSASPITQMVAGAMSFEQVATEDIGDWVAVQRFFKMGIGAILAVLSGFIWDILGGQWIFLIVAGIEVLVRLPLLISIPETLNKKAAA